MSGTAFGAIVLHISPEAAVGGPLGLVRDGDLIHLDVEKGSIELLVNGAELDDRRSSWSAPSHVHVERGYAKLYFDEVLQAEDGCDFNFLRARPRRRRGE
jgi:dihydroxy-acid dehydratase